MKGNARKVRTLASGKVIAGFAGGTADAFTLFELFEGKIEVQRLKAEEQKIKDQEEKKMENCIPPKKCFCW